MRTEYDDLIRARQVETSPTSQRRDEENINLRIIVELVDQRHSCAPISKP